MYAQIYMSVYMHAAQMCEPLEACGGLGLSDIVPEASPFET